LWFPPFFKGGLGGICGYQGSEKNFGNHYKSPGMDELFLFTTIISEKIMEQLSP
jgi:hypothetical protein